MKWYAFCIVFLILVCAGFVAAVPDGETVKTLNYDYYSNSPKYFELKYPTVKIIVNTVDEAIMCRYDESNVSYDSMDGNFDLSSGFYHENTFTGMGDGIYTFYIKCDTISLNSSEPAELKLVLRVNSLVTARIVLDDDPPLQSGRTELTLLTSKVVANPPSLKYSFDGIVYNDLPLFGSETIWKGYLIIPKTLKDSIVSFEFSANDLEGRQGTEITSGNVFLIDTVKPLIISDFEAVGYEGEIELNWHLPTEDDIVEYKIYRSSSPNLDYTDYYATVGDEDDISYTDTSADKGKTYYYRITAIDEAGNEGDLSKEVFATSLKKEVSETDSGLAPYLISKVENFIIEVDSVIDDLDYIVEGISSKSDTEQNLFQRLGLEKELKNSRSELVVLKNDADKYKLQDLNEEELDKKIDSLQVKLDVIRKKIPENLVVLEEDSEEKSFSEADIREAMLLVNDSLSERQISNSVKITQDYIEEYNLRVESNYYFVEINYLDGTSKEISVVTRDILGEVERSDNTNFLEIVSRNVADDESEITFKLGDYSIRDSNPVFVFETDIKNIVYFVSGEVDLSYLAESKFVFIKFYESEESSGPGITGYFFQDMGTIEYGGLGLGLLIIIILIIYFVFLKKKKISEKGKIFLEQVEKLYKAIDSKSLSESRIIYLDLKEEYKNLEDRDKKYFHKEMFSAHERILAIEIEEEIEKLKEGGSEESFKKLEEKYLKLSEKSKKRVKEAFEKVKNDFYKNE